VMLFGEVWEVELMRFRHMIPAFPFRILTRLFAHQ
jgi:hypothetical protein